MVSACQVRELLRSYLSGVVGLQSFADQFESLYSDMNASGESEALAIGDRVEGYLSRVSSGYSSENDLRAWLLPLSGESASANVVIAASPFPVSVNQFVLEERAFPALPASSGTSPGVVFGSVLSLQS